MFSSFILLNINVDTLRSGSFFNGELNMIRCTEGQYSMNRIPVISHVTDIPVRLKELNRAFFVMFNTKKQEYEIHCSDQPFSTLACVLPYEELDARAITYVQEHSAERLEMIVREIDKYNERLVAKAEAEMIDKANYKMREAFNYLKNNSKTDSIPQEVICE